MLKKTFLTFVFLTFLTTFYGLNANFGPYSNRTAGSFIGSAERTEIAHTISVYDELIRSVSEEEGYDWRLMSAIAYHESRFSPDIVSKRGAAGLMQIMPATFDWLQTHKGTEPKLDASALYDPQVNVEYGVYFLSILWEEYDDETVILSAYNAGMGNVDQWLSEEEHSSDGVTLHDIPYGETEQYVKNVLESQEMYRRLYGEEFKNWR